MNRTTLGLLAVGAVVGALIVTGLESAQAAIINKTVVVQGNSAHVHALRFHRERGEASVRAEICATAMSADGGVAEHGCEDVLSLPGAIETSVLNLMDNQAAVLWRTRRGLEQ